MNGKDPFGGDDDDIDATVMRPPAFGRPSGPAPGPAAGPGVGTGAQASPHPTARGVQQGGGRTGSPPTAPSPAARVADIPLPAFGAIDEATLTALTSHGTNPLLAAAAPLLTLVARLRDLPTHRDVESLRERVIAELRRFETSGIQAGITTDQVRVGRYALCATVDDVVLNTPWGGQSGWAGRSMVSTIHKETWGGERFFELLEQMQAEPKRYLLELELLYACLSLGFEGRYRVQPRGYAELSRLRDGLYRVLRRERGDVERELSPQWRGVADRYRPLGAVIPVWVGAAVLAAGLMFAYMALAWSLSGRTDVVYQQLAALLPNRPVEIARLAPPPLPPAAPSESTLQRMSQTLADDVAAGRIEILEEDGGVMIRTRANVFLSASDTIEPAFIPVIDRVGAALKVETGPVQVIGHTDSQPIRTIRFPSNQELSEARATAVEKRLAQTLGGDERLTAEGRGAREPIATNDTADGRARNRRIDILLLSQ